MSAREASRVFGLHRDTVRKMLAYSAPPGYRRQDPPRRPKLAPFTGVIDAILETDRQVPRKQRHTAKRIFERLRDEHGFDGQYTIVKDYVRERRRRTEPGGGLPGQSAWWPLIGPPPRWSGHTRCAARVNPGRRSAARRPAGRAGRAYRESRGGAGGVPPRAWIAASRRAAAFPPVPVARKLTECAGCPTRPPILAGRSTCGSAVGVE